MKLPERVIGHEPEQPALEGPEQFFQNGYRHGRLVHICVLCAGAKMLRAFAHQSSAFEHLREYHGRSER